MSYSNLSKIKTRVSLLASIVVLSGATFMGCKKDSNTQSGVTEEEATEVITEAISDETGGMTEQTEIAARTATESTLSCNEMSDTSFSGASLPGAAITYSYSQHASTQMICENGIPSQFEFDFTGENSYSAPRMSSDDSNSATFTVDGLKPSADNLTINALYTRNGTQQSKVRLQRSFSSTLNISSAAITVNKETSKITGGSASIAFDGTGSDGKKVSYGATLTFLGNNQATLVFNNGNTYTIQW